MDKFLELHKLTPLNVYYKINPIGLPKWGGCKYLQAWGPARGIRIWTELFLLIFSILVFLSIKFFDLFKIQIASWNFQSFSHNISHLKKMEELKLKLKFIYSEKVKFCGLLRIYEL